MLLIIICKVAKINGSEVMKLRRKAGDQPGWISERYVSTMTRRRRQ